MGGGCGGGTSPTGEGNVGGSCHRDPKRSCRNNPKNWHPKLKPVIKDPRKRRAIQHLEKPLSFTGKIHIIF